MPPKSKRVLPGKRYPLNMRTTKELRDKIEEAATASGRSLVQEVEFRLERSFRQQEIEREIKNALEARAASVRDELIGEMRKMLEPFQRALGLNREEIAAAAQRPKLSLLDLAQDTEGPSEQPKGESGQPRDLRGLPDDTSEQPDKKEDSK
jgi:Arc-like DNA binding dprotein